MGDQATSATEKPKRNRGRPLKAQNVEVLPPPPLPSPGVGVYMLKDGNTYFSTRGIINVSASQLLTQTSNPSSAKAKKNYSQP